jgi:hypothetical protein
MAQETLYFPHDYEPFSDMKLAQLVKKHGVIGYGVFWRIVELLHQDADHHLPFMLYVYEDIADKLSVTPKQVETIIYACIDDYALFGSDGEIFWSERVFKNINKRKETLKQKSEAGKASADARRKLKELVDAHPELMGKIEHPLNTR